MPERKLICSVVFFLMPPQVAFIQYFHSEGQCLFLLLYSSTTSTTVTEMIIMKLWFTPHN